jgi:hypothetical protein
MKITLKKDGRPIKDAEVADFSLDDNTLLVKFDKDDEFEEVKGDFNSFEVQILKE